MTHTPGPWAAEVTGTGFVFTGPKGSVNEFGFECSEEDARLIAAAPDLLAALERCAALLGRYPKHDAAWAHARAVISRAKGK